MPFIQQKHTCPQLSPEVFVVPLIGQTIWIDWNGLKCITRNLKLNFPCHSPQVEKLIKDYGWSWRLHFNGQRKVHSLRLLQIESFQDHFLRYCFQDQTNLKNSSLLPIGNLAMLLLLQLLIRFPLHHSFLHLQFMDIFVIEYQFFHENYPPEMSHLKKTTPQSQHFNLKSL